MSKQILSSERSVLANGLRHHVRIWEPAAPDAAACKTLLCAHGFLDASASFRFLGEAWAARGHRLIAFDWRGHGRSEWVGAGGYYHFFDYVADLAGLVAALELEPLHLLGHSMGGTAASLFAGAFPERVRNLVLVEGLGPEERAPAAEVEVEGVRAWIEAVRTARARPVRVMASMEEAAERIRRGNPELLPAQALEMARGSTREVAEGLVWSYDPIHRTQGPYRFSSARFQAFLRAIRAPVLLVDGEKGYRTTDQEARVQAVAARRHVVVPDAGHMLHLSAPERLAQEVASFLDT